MGSVMANRLISIARLLMGVAALLGGCATPGGSFLNTNTPADAGSAPTQYEQTIRTYLRTALKDPHSMIDFSISEPIQTSCSVGIYGYFHGWRVTVSYNAKNSFGGYVGLQTHYYWFHGDFIKGIGNNPSSCPEAPGWR